MTITNPIAYTRDTANWTHSTFIVSLGVDYATYKDILTYSSQDETYGSVAKPGLDPVVQSALNSIGEGGILPLYFSIGKCRDTSLGGNDVINSYYQYCENDDIAHPFHVVGGALPSGLGSMGRVYNETIDENQQIMYLSFGIPVYNTLSAFYSNLVNNDLANLMNRGISMNPFTAIGQLIGSSISTIISFPAMPVLWVDKLLHRYNTPISKYYDFKSEMLMYYRFVNTILVTLGVNMGYMDTTSLSGSQTSTGSNTSNISSLDLINSTAGTSQAWPGDFITTYQLDIYRILARKRWYEMQANSQFQIKDFTTDQAIASVANTDSETSPNANVVTWTKAMITGFNLGAGGSISAADMFIGFKVEKSTDSSESISNQTSESSIQQTINSKMESARNYKFSTEDGQVGGILGNLVGDALGMLNNVIQGAATSLGLSGLTSLATGSGMVSIPEKWDNSSFNKSYSFSMKFYSPYGDPMSILQSVYVPLACLLAGCLPRAIGTNSYTSPFFVRAYCKGMFSVPLGMIDHIDIHRGGSVHGWSKQRLPTEVTASFSIKDMTPAMFMAIGDSKGLFDAILGENSSMSEYLATLSGLGLKDRVDFRLNSARKTTTFFHTLLSRALNPIYWGTALANIAPIQAIANILPTARQINNN